MAFIPKNCVEPTYVYFIYFNATKSLTHPSLDWTKANSFHVSEAVTEGSEVMPSTTARANAVTPTQHISQLIN